MPFVPFVAICRTVKFSNVRAFFSNAQLPINLLSFNYILHINSCMCMCCNSFPSAVCVFAWKKTYITTLRAQNECSLSFSIFGVHEFHRWYAIFSRVKIKMIRSTKFSEHCTSTWKLQRDYFSFDLFLCIFFAPWFNHHRRLCTHQNQTQFALLKSQMEIKRRAWVSSHCIWMLEFDIKWWLKIVCVIPSMTVSESISNINCIAEKLCW